MKTSFIAATILSVSLFSGAASAQESVLSSLLGNMVNQAVSMTTSELQANVYQSVANASYHFELDSEVATGRVSVTDLAATDESSETEGENEAE